jgi:hypothetical protein
MNLYRIGDTVLNMDRVNGIQDHQPPSDLSAVAGANVIRVLFDTTTIDLRGVEAQTFRQWFRHAARNLVLHKDEDGEELMSPAEQLQRVSDRLLMTIDRSRPRNAAVQHAAHRLSGLINDYITGELHPVRTKDFEKSIATVEAEGDPAPGSFAGAPEAP